MKDKPAVSVVILTWNGAAYIKDCLTALLAQEYPQFGAIVVDNGSSDGTADLVAKEFTVVKLVRNGRNLGFSAGNNVGLRVATGDVLVLLNQDTRVHPGWLAALALPFNEPDVGIVGSKLLYPDDTIQHAGGYLYGSRGLTGHVGRHAEADGQLSRLADTDFVTGAAVAISRETLAQIGPLDEGFAPAYYEDIDWCYRARSAGRRVLYQPRAVVTHYESTTTDARGYERAYALNQGRLRFLFKHWPLDRLLNEFAPAELNWIAAMDRSEELMAARRGYLNNLLMLPGILAFRRSSPEETRALVGLLTDLRAVAVAGVASLPPIGDTEALPFEGELPTADLERAHLFQALQTNQTLCEHVFTSEVPVLGRFIACLRRLWNSVAAEWYVRPVMHQQSIFNAQMVTYMRGLEQRMERDVAENIRELTTLAEHVAAMETRPSDRSHPAGSKD